MFKALRIQIKTTYFETENGRLNSSSRVFRPFIHIYVYLRGRFIIQTMSRKNIKSINTRLLFVQGLSSDYSTSDNLIVEIHPVVIVIIS